ncbi:MAG: hypothetical protein EHM58_13220 [Ignavibacteriae bacterium]|nr:MAG: hypothetical protein EHM58_13220 [Ignavibacteriota bacterium]
MYLLRIEHAVNDYNGWKKSFDSDPIGREKSGVRQYRIMRPAGDEKTVMIDLEFDERNQAESALSKLREVWKQVQGSVIFNPKVQIVETLETKKF